MLSVIGVFRGEYVIFQFFNDDGDVVLEHKLGTKIIESKLKEQGFFVIELNGTNYEVLCFFGCPDHSGV